MKDQLIQLNGWDDDRKHDVVFVPLCVEGTADCHCSCSSTVPNARSHHHASTSKTVMLHNAARDSRFFSSCQRRHQLNISVLLMFNSFPTLYALLPHIIIPMAIPFVTLCAITHQKWRGKTAVFCTWHSERFSFSKTAALFGGKLNEDQCIANGKRSLFLSRSIPQKEVL